MARLIERGADAVAQNTDGTTPLHGAPEWGHVDGSAPRRARRRRSSPGVSDVAAKKIKST